MILPDLEPLVVPLSNLVPLPGNPRKGDVEAVKRSYAVFGQRKPIVARRTGESGGKPSGVVIAGNHQLAAAQALGWEEMAVVWVDDDDVTAKAFALADNRTADLGTYDDEALAALLSDVAAADEALFAATAYAQSDLDALLESLKPAPAALTDPDEVPEPPADPVTRPGDLWLLGPHRLLCGDATVVTDVERLMNGQKASLAVTDPPYNVKLDYSSHADDYSEADYEAFCRLWFANLQAHSERQIVTPAWANLAVWCRMFDPHFIAPWTKANSVTPGPVSRWTCWEPLLFFGQGWKAGGQRASDLFDFPIGQQKGTEGKMLHEEHPCPKPVAMWADLIANYASAGSGVLDLFGGTGTTAIAAHKTGHTAFLLEMDPGYCDLICRRYQEHTGITPTHADTGEPFRSAAEVGHG